MDCSSQRELAISAALQAERVRSWVGAARFGPIDPIAIAEKCECEVRFMALPSLEGIYSPDHKKGTIILGSQRPAGRRAFTCAHELGHHIFGHGMRVDEIDSRRFELEGSPDEFLADMFAAFLLMPKLALIMAIKDFSLNTIALTPLEIFRLASYFGVGYTTILNHLRFSLNLISYNAWDALIKTPPKAIKKQLGGSPGLEVVIANELWKERPIDLEIGDLLVMPEGFDVSDTKCLTSIYGKNDCMTFKAKNVGYTNAFCSDKSWITHVRIGQKEYEGLARFRFYGEPTEGAHEH